MFEIFVVEDVRLKEVPNQQEVKIKEAVAVIVIKIMLSVQVPLSRFDISIPRFVNAHLTKLFKTKTAVHPVPGTCKWLNHMLKLPVCIFMFGRAILVP